MGHPASSAASPGRMRAPGARCGSWGDRLAAPPVARRVHVLRLARRRTAGKARGAGTCRSAGLACAPRCRSSASASFAAARCASTSATGAIPALPPLVIVHGLRDHSHSFDDLARGLLDRFHVLALDLRGHGDSETTPYYGFGHFVLDLHNLIRALRLERPVLIGHSMGGEIVANYAGCFPDVPAQRGDHRGPRAAAARHGRGGALDDRRLRAHRPRLRRPSRPDATSTPPTGACASATRACRRPRRASWRCSARGRARTARSSGSSTPC